MENNLYRYLAQFDFLSVQEVDYIAASFTHKKIRKNELLVKEGQICDLIAFVEKGAVRAFTSDDKGEEHTTCFSFENQLVTVFDSFVSRKKAHKSIQAIEESSFFTINYPTFQHLSATLPSWIYLQEQLTRQAFEEKEYYHIHLKNKTAKDKYAHLLNEQAEIIKRASVAQIASYLGMTPRTLTRVKREILYPGL